MEETLLGFLFVAKALVGLLSLGRLIPSCCFWLLVGPSPEVRFCYRILLTASLKLDFDVMLLVVLPLDLFPFLNRLVELIWSRLGVA